MIFDNIDNLTKFIPENYHADVFNTLNKIDLFDFGTYDISEGFTLKVLDTKTKPECDTKIETHDHHIDVQMLLSGEEIMNMYIRNRLSIDVEWNPEKDVTFYKKNLCPDSTIRLMPGYFVMFYPNDAHQPQIMVDHVLPLKKIVLKLEIK